MKKNFLILWISPLILLAAWSAKAGDVEVPEEELAKESVLPRFERGEAVKNRNIVTDKRFELGAYGGWNFTEPIYSQTKFGFNAGYHWTEDSALMFNLAYWFPGRNTQYTDLLKTQGVDFSKTPDIQFALWANYELQAYYGKVSLTKRGVMNLHLYPILGLGGTKYTNKFYPGLNFGIGQKFYFTKSLALRVDFKLQYASGPNPFLGGGLLNVNKPVPDPSNFADKFSLGTILDVGVSILL